MRDDFFESIIKVLSFGEDLGEAFMETYLISAKKQFQYYKLLAERTFAQLSDEELFWKYNDESNSIAAIINHMAGNMLSRWTDFLTTDGEKPWRQRDREFEDEPIVRTELLKKWEDGWACLFTALDSIQENDWRKQVFIRSEPHTIVDAINRQLAHYPYHVGQMVFIGKMLTDSKWNSLTIPKGKSVAFNAEMFNPVNKK